MKAVEFDRFGAAEVLVVREVADPVPGPGELLVRVHATAVNPKDTFMRKGRFPLMTGRRFPQRTGYEFAGIAVESGERVWGAIDGFAGGGAAELYVARPDRVGVIPDGLSFEEAAAMPLAAQTALQALRDEGAMRAGARVLVHGASGGVGTFALQIAKALGAAHVTAIAGAKNHALCRELGADATVDYAQAPPADVSGPFDVWLDVFGNQSFARVKRHLAPRGRYVTTVPRLATIARHRLLPFGKRARLVAIRSRRADLDVLAGWVREKKLRAIVDRVYAFAEIADAHRHVESKHSRGKVVVRVAAT